MVSRARPQSCSTCTLQQSFCHSSGEIRAAFDDLRVTVEYGEGETVFREADRCHSVFAICKGSVKLVTGSSEGRILLLRFAEPGELLGLAEAMLGPTPYQCSAIAAGNTTLAVIPQDAFLRFVASYPEARLGVAIALSAQYRLALREAKFLGFGDSSAVRLAHLLVEWSAGQGIPGEDRAPIPICVTHLDLAQAIGATRETVTRLLADFSHDGLIERRANAIVVLRPAALAHLCNSPRVTSNRDADAPGSEPGDLSMLQERLAPGGAP